MTDLKELMTEKCPMKKLKNSIELEKENNKFKLSIEKEEKTIDLEKAMLNFELYDTNFKKYISNIHELASPTKELLMLEIIWLKLLSMEDKIKEIKNA